MKHFTQIGSDAKCRLDIYHWGAGLAVTGRIRDNGQKVLQSAFETGISSRSSYCHSLSYCISRGGLYLKYNVIIIL